MSVLEQVASTLMRVIRMNDRLAVLTEKVDQQQQRIEDVSARLIRLETALEFGLAQSSGPKGRRRRLPKPGP